MTLLLDVIPPVDLEAAGVFLVVFLSGVSGADVQYRCICALKSSQLHVHIFQTRVMDTNPSPVSEQAKYISTLNEGKNRGNHRGV